MRDTHDVRPAATRPASRRCRHRVGSVRRRRRPNAARVLAMVAMLALTAVAAPAVAAPAERLDSIESQLYADWENGFVVFVNYTREAFCAWEASGYEGDAPVTRLVPLLVVETGKGAIVGTWGGAVELELWRFDDVLTDQETACTATDEQTGPWAVGSGHFRGNDNDFDISGTRTNTFGGRLQATVIDGDGQRWHYSSMDRLQIDRDGNWTLRALKLHLVRMGGGT
jgi:hypothetical protein